MQKHFLSVGLYEFKPQHFCPGVWPSPWKKRRLLGKEPDLPTRQDIHAWSSYTSWRWELGILHPRSPCLLHTEASLCSALALAQSSLQKAPCSWQDSWHNGCYPTSPPLPSLEEERKSEAGSHILSYGSTTPHCCGVPATQPPVYTVTISWGD